MRYTLIEQHDGYSTYSTDDGTEVYIASGGFPLRFLIEWDWDTILGWWGQFSRYDHNARSRFIDLVRTKVIDPDEGIDQIQWCQSCSNAKCEDDGQSVEGDEWACQGCIDDHYSSCNDCDTLSTDTRWTLHDESICTGCYENSYDYCEDCDGYYHIDYRSEHEHEPEGMRCCESPAQGFTVRNDGNPALANDTRTTVTLAAGVIDSEGVNRIYQWLAREGLYELANLATEMDPKWQTKEGNFTKRLSKAAHKRRQELTKDDENYVAQFPGYGPRYADAIERLKTPPKVLSMIGTIAGEHSRAVDFTIEVTRNLNLSAEEFGHEDSCWWQSYYSGRCALKTNGGFGLRTFDPNSSWDNVTGRAWVLPLRLVGDKNLTPTFESQEPDAFVVFNGYGQLEGYNATRIISYMSGMTYRKITFTCSPMYVNGNMGYLVAPEEICAFYTDGSLNLEVDQHSDLYQTERAAKALAAAATPEKELVNA